MIDEVRLLEIIKENSYPVSYGRNNQEQGMTVSGIMQAIEELTKTNGWIPCSERIPDKEGCYLVTISKEYCPDEESRVKTAFLNEKVGHSEFKRLVTAWQPRPKPYVGDEQEE